MSAFCEGDGRWLAGWASGGGFCSRSTPQVLVVSFSKPLETKPVSASSVVRTPRWHCPPESS